MFATYCNFHSLGCSLRDKLNNMMDCYLSSLYSPWYQSILKVIKLAILITAAFFEVRIKCGVFGCSQRRCNQWGQWRGETIRVRPWHLKWRDLLVGSTILTAIFEVTTGTVLSTPLILYQYHDVFYISTCQWRGHSRKKNEQGGNLAHMLSLLSDTH